ncbi:hypothetical protein RN607_00790 [Demequina capsici]|uniref:Uncharacterized protein n=1 Tax=Demequina capsici TaxID=3075620 RepID=A0AA96JAN9_9MICO|nr:hypothetical protein [Demequina sp. PMTSA13]WNM27570.1 hypothetical protein RN607_00790 [Demequina sp. PMTSA13]
MSTLDWRARLSAADWSLLSDIDLIARSATREQVDNVTDLLMQWALTSPERRGYSDEEAFYAMRAIDAAARARRRELDDKLDCALIAHRWYMDRERIGAGAGPRRASHMDLFA